MVILIPTGIREVGVFKWIFLGVYVLGLFLFVGAGVASRVTKRKLLPKVLLVVSTFLMTSWAAYTLVLLIRAGVSPTLFNVLYAVIVVFNVVFSSSLFILAIFGELDLCPDSNESSEDNYLCYHEKSDSRRDR